MNFISYDGLKIVLQYLEGNKRFQLVNRCPSLRKVDKLVPLTLDYLDISNNYSISVNHTEYCIGISQHWKYGETCKRIKKINENGGLKYDLNEHGFPMLNKRFEILPGDLIMCMRGKQWDHYRDQDSYFNEEELVHAEEDLAQHYQYAIDAKMKGYYDGPKYWSSGYKNFGEALEEWIEEKEYKVLPYRCVVKFYDYPFENSIQLTTNSPDPTDNKKTIKKYETVKYTKNIHHAMKYFLNKLLGGRRHPIYVKTLDLFYDESIIRLPENIKFHVRKLKTWAFFPFVYETFLPYFDESCLPIKHMDIWDGDALDHPVFQKTKNLTVSRCMSHLSAIEVLRKIYNGKVNSLTLVDQVSGEDQFSLIESWIKNGKKVGTCFQIGLMDESTVIDALELIQKNLSDKIRFDQKNLIFELEDDAELVISYRRLCRKNSLNWFLKMSVVPREESHNLDLSLCEPF